MDLESVKCDQGNDERERCFDEEESEEESEED